LFGHIAGLVIGEVVFAPEFDRLVDERLKVIV
jgi:hypothetical protein